MSDLIKTLRERVAWDNDAINAHISELWPGGDDTEISEDDALKLLAYLAKWNHARLTPILEKLIAVVEAVETGIMHHEDCMDAQEKREQHEVCECGASAINDVIADLRAIMGMEGK